MRILIVLYRVLLLVLIFVLVCVCTVSACLPTLRTVHSSHLLSLGMLVCLVTSCMVLADHLILKANTALNLRHVCFMLWASKLRVSDRFSQFHRVYRVEIQCGFRNSLYN